MPFGLGDIFRKGSSSYRSERRPSRTPSRSRRVYEELTNSTNNFNQQRERFDRGSIGNEDYTNSYRRLDRARIARREESDYQADRRQSANRRAHQASGFYSSEPEEVRRKARFEQDVTKHRRESQYRDENRYRRGSEAYQPGRYSDCSGSGFYNTSQPPLYMNARRPGSSSTRRPSTAQPQYEEIRPTGLRRESTYGPQPGSGRRSSVYGPSPSSYDYEERRPPGSKRGRSSRRTHEDDYQDWLGSLSDEELRKRRRDAERAALRFKNAK